MTNEKDKKPELKSFEVETIYEGSAHERHAFTVTIDGNEYKGHFHDDKIHWLHPQPQQTFGEITLNKVEASIFKLMSKHGISSGIEEFEIEKLFEERAHERYQFTIQVFGEELKGFVHKGEIQWFHPHPKQNLEKEHVLAIETEVQKMVEGHENTPGN